MKTSSDFSIHVVIAGPTFPDETQEKTVGPGMDISTALVYKA